ncbi:MAG TPA: glucose-6-phosphate isomerase family protein [Phototrophicaceae bacterium]|nr:glucose-6-phosphate isomerase family protein [Phototrophicaceae bacterium]
MAYIGVGGSIDGQINPHLTANVGFSLTKFEVKAGKIRVQFVSDNACARDTGEQRMTSGTPFSFHLETIRGFVEGILPIVTNLSDLAGLFADQAACEQALAQDNPVVYQVSSFTKTSGEGQLHFGFGMLMPGRVGAEYFMTRGHLHRRRDAAEIYVGLGGKGLLLLENEQTGESDALPLAQHDLVYVPGFTAHRTINIGAEPLFYVGVYSAEAGHDYEPILKQNFRKLVIDVDGMYQVIDRPAR